MDNGMLNLMYTNAYMNLSNGIVNPLDKEILSYAPLPDSVIDPYITQEVDPLTTMNLTNNTLKVWIEESKKANYFSAHFVTLSRMIMNGVATMARGLVTLHMRGEELDQAPLSIQDLIKISSYQFRKSYIGVLQTVKSKPEVSERLLMNQLRWNNTLIKLFKTREKLDRPVTGVQCSVVRENSESSEFKVQSSNMNDEKSLPESGDGSVADFQVSGLESDVLSPGSDVSSPLSELPALSAPGAYGAIRPYSALTAKGSRKAVTGNRKAAAESLSSETDKSLENGRPAVQPESENGKELKNGNNESRELQQDLSPETTQPVQTEDNETRDEGSGMEENENLKNLSSETKENPVQDHESGKAVGSEEAKKPEENSSFLPPDPALPDRPPEYARILYRAVCRSSGNEDGALEFTLDEINTLLADPEFCKYEPQLAADLWQALRSAGP